MATFNSLATPSVNNQYTAAIASQVKDNFDFFRSPPRALYSPSVAASNITTTSTVFVDLTGFTVNFDSQGGLLLLALLGRCFGSVANILRFDFALDGLNVSADSNGVGSVPSSAASIPSNISLFRLVDADADNHDVKVQWRVTSGTGTIEPAGLCQLVVWEVFLAP